MRTHRSTRCASADRGRRRRSPTVRPGRPEHRCCSSLGSWASCAHNPRRTKDPARDPRAAWARSRAASGKLAFVAARAWQRPARVQRSRDGRHVGPPGTAWRTDRQPSPTTGACRSHSRRPRHLRRSAACKGRQATGSRRWLSPSPRQAFRRQRRPEPEPPTAGTLGFRPPYPPRAVSTTVPRTHKHPRATPQERGTPRPAARASAPAPSSAPTPDLVPRASSPAGGGHCHLRRFLPFPFSLAARASSWASGRPDTLDCPCFSGRPGPTNGPPGRAWAVGQARCPTRHGPSSPACRAGPSAACVFCPD